ncbi:SpoIIE family protein phosphatase, partial [Kitasatospora sp. NPDC059408]|uniref:SpoIIE family protein phosphatase n=1 Tax=Kitasatospora sp. NPDC059408 TaxID=3346823 RepID=UPI003683F197
LYTDGLVEDPAVPIDQGLERLRSVLGRPGGEGLEGLADRVLREVGSTHRVDDVALLLTEFRGVAER